MGWAYRIMVVAVLAHVAAMSGLIFWGLDPLRATGALVALVGLSLIFGQFISWKRFSRLDREIALLREMLEWDEEPTKRNRIPATIRASILQRDSYTCSWCGRAGSEALDPDGHPWHIDHVIPVARGGPTKPSNLTTACRSCNARKSDKAPFEFLRWR